jgi:hypothetical protein
MKTLFNRNTGIAAFAAVVIVGLTGLTMDRSYESALPKGTVEVGELQPVFESDVAIAVLPAVEVRGTRISQLADATIRGDAQG